MWLLIASLLLSPAIGCAQQTRLGGPPPDREKERLEAVSTAKAHLAESLKLAEEKIALESADPATWPDASLGCPVKDRVYAQVVTRGWKVVLKAEGRPHELHVAGRRVVECHAEPGR